MSLLISTLVGCGGGGGTVDSRASYSISLSAARATLLSNVANILPNIGGTYTTTLYVKAQDNSGKPAPDKTGAFSCNIESGLESGALYYLDGKPEHEKEETVGGTTVKLPIAYRSVTLDSTAGGASFHFHASSTAGTALIRCAYTDPNGQIHSATLAITVGGTSSAQAAQVAFADYLPGYLYVLGQNQPVQANLRLAVVDEAGRPVPQSMTNNVRLRLLPTSTADESASLTGINAAGQLQIGRAISLRTDAEGLAQFTLSSGTVAGSLMLEATADRADNNVDNGISDPVYGYLSVPVVSQVPAATGLAISTATLPPATRSLPYAALIEASGGSPPYTWNLVNEKLPNGLALSSTGIISGTPKDSATTGTYNFVVEVRDRLGTGVRKNLSLVLQ